MPVGLIIFVVSVVAFAAGYAFRGAIRRELSVAATEAGQIVGRLENAARGGAAELEQEVVSVIAHLKSKF